MFPITVITWRLSQLGNHDFEDYIVSTDKSNEFKYFLRSYDSVYCLQSCQRLVFVLETTDNQVINEFYTNYWKFTGSQNLVIPEIFKGKSALEHLSIIISSLDSIVIGETEIQGQFKKAFKQCQPNMSPFLIDTMAKIIHIGKKIRSHPLLAKGRISTISIAHELLQSEFEKSNSIGIIGTGKMARGIIRYLLQRDYNIVVYTKSRERCSQHYLNVKFSHISEIKDHDILITATDHKKIVDKKFIQQNSFKNTKFLIDLGIPRNCDSNIQEIENLSLYTIEDLLSYSQNNKDESMIDELIQEVKYHVNFLIKEHYRNQNKDIILSLRRDLYKEVNHRKSQILENIKGEKEFDQFVKSLIHISQQHLERNMQQLLELDRLEEN